MKILVTGHKGYIGSHLFAELQSRGFSPDGIDLQDGHDIRTHLPDESYDYVFHLAANPRVGYSVENPSQTLDDNVLVTSKLLEWAKSHGVKRVIHSSSSAVHGQGDGVPQSPYGLHKKMNELEMQLYADLYGLDSVCLRYYNVFSKDQPFGGSYSTAICAWYNLLSDGKPLRLDGTGEQTRDFIHVDDVVDANIFFMEYDGRLNGLGVEIGTGEALSLLDIKEVIDSNHPNVEWDFAPLRRGDVMHTRANTMLAKELGWKSKRSSFEEISKIFRSKAFL